jgi:hypothetical protein
MRLLDRNDVHSLAAARSVIENDRSIGNRIERVITAASNIIAGVNARATLSHKDASREHDVAAKFLHTQTF